MAEEKENKIEKESKETKKVEEVKKAPEKKEEKKVVEKLAEKLKVSKEKDAKVEEKIELEREYIVPLRRGSNKVQQYRRAKKAVKVLKEFIAKHMKVEKRDIRKVKVDMYLNEEIWHRGIKNPLHKVKVKAVKKAGIVYVELAELPKQVQFRKQKLEKRKTKVSASSVKKAPEKKEEKVEESKDTKEKEAATVEAGFKENKKQANTQKHTQSAKKVKSSPPISKALR